jgi:hypothetical protein
MEDSRELWGLTGPGQPPAPIQVNAPQTNSSSPKPSWPRWSATLRPAPRTRPPSRPRPSPPKSRMQMLRHTPYWSRFLRRPAGAVVVHPSTGYVNLNWDKSQFSRTPFARASTRGRSRPNPLRPPCAHTRIGTSPDSRAHGPLSRIAPGRTSRLHPFPGRRGGRSACEAGRPRARSDNRPGAPAPPRNGNSACRSAPAERRPRSDGGKRHEG